MAFINLLFKQRVTLEVVQELFQTTEDNLGELSYVSLGEVS